MSRLLIIVGSTRPGRAADAVLPWVVTAAAGHGDFEVEVARTLNKWCVTVYQLPDRTILAQDFFPERWKALARAQDFVRLLNQRNKREGEGSEAI